MLLCDFFSQLYCPLRLRSRSPNTVRLYAYSCRCFSQSLGHAATLDDLTDDTVSRHLARLAADHYSPYSINKERSQLLAMWSWAARKKLVDRWPDVPPERTPTRVPVAWLASEMRRLIVACRAQPGEYLGVPASSWWACLHLVCWDTAERIGAVRQLKWDHLSTDGWLLVPAELRKGHREDKRFRLGADTLAELEAIRLPTRAMIFPWPYSETYIYRLYSRILQRAGLPTDSRSKFHRLRRTVASYYELHGGNAMELLGHGSRATTRRYLDPRILVTKQPCDVLFRLA
jgi:integrase